MDIIYKTMAQCGLTHDEGPDLGGPVGPYVQTQRRDLYGKYAQLLLEKGRAPLKGCVSSKTGKVYDAAVVLEDDGDRVRFKLVFGNG